ncbi:glycosyltransferase [Lactococcus garvieae]|uniref:glycosyltransferase n=1 Tax=Lactococcus garvieae TaxID=1363 RepID=UPI00398F6C13
MKNITFAVGDLRMGGSMRVQSVIANNLDKEKYNITIFSMRKVKSYFHLEPEIVYAENAMTDNQFRAILVKTGIQKYILRRAVDMTVIPNVKMVQDLVKYVKKNDVETLILVEQWAVVAKELKEQLPDVELISWLHLNVKTYESFLYGKSYPRLEASYGYSDVICVLTKEDQTILNAMGLKKVKVMHNPLTIESHEDSVNLASKTISFVGRIDYHHKGLDYLLEIAQQMDNDWEIQIAGKGLFFEEKRFARDIKKLHLEDKIKWQGALTGQNLNQHYLNSSIYIMTSRFEGFGLVLIEAMSFGLPVLSMSNSGSEEVLEQGKYGILAKQGDVSDFLKKLKQLQESEDLRLKFSKLSKERAAMFSVDRIIARWESLLD